MPTPLESKRVMRVLTDQAVGASQRFAAQIQGPPELRRRALLEVIPELIGYYADGTAALAADLYADERAAAARPTRYTVRPVVLDRTVKVRRGIAWATEPWFDPMDVTTEQRLAMIVQLEVARPYRDTILTNRRQDPDCVGWQRITTGGCKFCRMLADRGAVYRESNVRFAAHDNCHCTAAPVFLGGSVGPEANVYQYMASRGRRTPEQRAVLRDYLNLNYPDAPG